MDTKASDAQFKQQEPQRVEFPRPGELEVIVDFNRRLEKVERKVSHFGDLTILVIGVGLGISVGEIIENLDSSMSWGWPAALACGVTIVVITFVLRSFFR
jgi:hypothetical protein